MPASAVYLYCVVRSPRKPALARVPPGLPGADHPALHAMDDGVWLVTANVPAAEYTGEALESSLRDLEWVSRVALAHEGVVEHFAAGRGAAVIPMKLFTMFSSAERATAEMRAKADALAPIFERIAGCEEWGVRIVRGERRPGVEQEVRAQSGTAFLAARKRARDEAHDAVRVAAEAADAAFTSLVEVARDGRRRAEQTSGMAVPLLDAAFLVPLRRRAQFRAAAGRAAEDVARRGGEMTLTGPWPPYNFVGSEERP